MTLDPQDLERLAGKWLAGVTTPEEAAALHAWFDTQGIADPSGEPGVEVVLAGEAVTVEEYREELWKEVASRIRSEPGAQVAAGQMTAPVRRLPRVWRYAVAAVLLLGVAVVYELWPGKPVPPMVVAVKPDVSAPATTRAVIRLPDGRQIDLDSARNGLLLASDNVSIVKRSDGQVAYTGGAAVAGEQLLYHELFVPRGSRPISVMLSDGTRVWLNAESSLRYPAAFPGSDRRVELKGEAYFEVARDAVRPFFVKTPGETIQVLGTEFNINAYGDDGMIRTTLLAGKVSVQGDSDRSARVLDPGQQAVGPVTGVKPLSVLNRVDTSVVMAWKNGRFEFNGAGLPEIMSQLRRWYDVDVQYEGALPVVNFRGRALRSANISSLLNILQATGSLHYEIRGRTVMIRP